MPSRSSYYCFFPSNSATNDLRVFGENRYERKSSGAGRRCLSESCMVVQIQGKYHDSGSWSSTKTCDDQSTKLTQTCLFCMFFCDRPPDLPAQNRTEDPAKKYIFNTHFIIQQNRLELLQEKLEKAENQHDITLRPSWTYNEIHTSSIVTSYIITLEM